MRFCFIKKDLEHTPERSLEHSRELSRRTTNELKWHHQSDNHMTTCFQ